MQNSSCFIVKLKVTPWFTRTVEDILVTIPIKHTPSHAGGGGGLAQLVATLVRSTKLLYAGPS